VAALRDQLDAFWALASYGEVVTEPVAEQAHDASPEGEQPGEERS
jgi:hypothetical protein